MAGAAPPPSFYDNMAAMPNVGGAPKPSPGGMDQKQAQIVAAYKAIDAALDKMGSMDPKLGERLAGVSQNLKAAIVETLNIDPKSLDAGDKGPTPPADNKSPQEPTAAPPDNKSPQDTPVPA
jgi:hypothetical protein